ncbi:MAG: hypothetical protein M3361_05910 [Candidatus Tectomicrobia bacterium]|nr:hypothetical protein [Candidatus Tectomicrobia bacterium]
MTNLLGLALVLVLPAIQRVSEVVITVFGLIERLIVVAIVVGAIACLIARVIFEPEYGPPLGIPSRQLFSAIILTFFFLPILVLFCVFAYEAFSTLLATPLFKKYNIFFFLILVIALLQFALRTDALQHMSWKKLADLWLKPPAVSTITVGGFGFIATSDVIQNPLLQLTMKSEYTNLSIIVPIALCGVVFMVLAIILERIGRSKSPDDNSNIPKGWFYTAFGFAFVANLLMFALLLTSMFLTVHTHYITQLRPGT